MIASGTVCQVISPPGSTALHCTEQLDGVVLCEADYTELVSGWPCSACGEDIPPDGHGALMVGEVRHTASECSGGNIENYAGFRSNLFCQLTSHKLNI